jgi:hypothetical protein
MLTTHLNFAKTQEVVQETIAAKFVRSDVPNREPRKALSHAPDHTALIVEQQHLSSHSLPSIEPSSRNAGSNAGKTIYSDALLD